jgi:predicted small metal-binding protein
MASYSFKCSDVGMTCGFEFKNASSKDEALQLAATHAKVTHGIAMIPPDLAKKVNAAIKG